MNKTLKEILETKIVSDKNGVEYDLYSSIPNHEGEFLTYLIKNNPINTSIEIGCAFGISSLYICDALSTKPNQHHTIIDPFQTKNWHGIGINNLHKAGFDFYTLIEEKSEIALPNLYKQNRKFDLGFIDGNHTFDQVLLDFFFLDKLLSVNGIIAFDDVRFRSINKVLRFILKNYPNYELIIPPLIKRKLKFRTKIKNITIKLINKFSKFIPRKLRSEVLNDKLLYPLFFDEVVYYNETNTIAIRKKYDYTQDSGEFVDF